MALFLLCDDDVYCMCFRPEDVQALISGKLALRYAGRQVSLFIPKNFNFISDFTSC